MAASETFGAWLGVMLLIAMIVHAWCALEDEGHVLSATIWACMVAAALMTIAVRLEWLSSQPLAADSCSRIQRSRPSALNR